MESNKKNMEVLEKAAKLVIGALLSRDLCVHQGLRQPWP